jgi:hypothetical protein
MPRRSRVNNSPTRRGAETRPAVGIGRQPAPLLSTLEDSSPDFVTPTCEAPASRGLQERFIARAEERAVAQ